MCVICSKINFTIESLEMVLDDNQMVKHCFEAGMHKLQGAPLDRPQDLAKGARISLILMAVCEMALNYQMPRDVLVMGLDIGIRRAAVKKFLTDTGQLDEEHKILEELNGWES